MTREEAIKIIRDNIPHLGIGATQMTEALGSLVPELRESEDERIRKEIVECIETLIKQPGASPRLCDWLAWLEKQKEQKPAEWSEEDEEMLEYIICDVNDAKQLYTIQEAKDMADKEIAWLKSLRPSWKPSEDEERLINTSISFLKDFADKGYENAVECIDWLKSKLNGNSGK